MSGVLNNKIKENYEIADKVTFLKGELRNLEEEYSEKYIRRSKEINEIIALEMRLESMTHQNNELETRLTELQKERDEKNAKFDQLMKENTELETSLRKANDQIAQYKNEGAESNQGESKLKEEVTAWADAYRALEISLNEEKKKNAHILDNLVNLQKENEERQKKIDLESCRQQKLIKDPKSSHGCNANIEEKLKKLQAELNAEKMRNATKQKLLDDVDAEKEKLKTKQRDIEEKLLTLQTNVAQNRYINESKENDLIKKLEAEKRARVAFESQLNELKAINSELVKNNRFLMDKIESVTRLNERIDQLDEKRTLHLIENQKIEEEIKRLSDKCNVNIKIMRETIDGVSPPLKRKLNENEKDSSFFSKKK